MTDRQGAAMNPIQQAIEQVTAARDWLPTICGELSGLDVPEDDANMRAAIAGLERVEGKIDAALTSLRSLNKEVEEAVVSVCRAVAELPDRNSPADWPEAMLVTHDELADAVRTAVAAALGRGAGQAEWRSTLQTAADALLEIIIAGQDAKRDLDVNIPKGDPVHPVSGKLTWPLSTAMLARNKALALLESTPEASQPEKSCGQCRHRHQDGRLGCARENCHGRIDWEPATQPTQAEAPSDGEALPTLPFAVFDEFGASCEDRVRDHFRAALAAQQAAERVPLTEAQRKDALAARIVRASPCFGFVKSYTDEARGVLDETYRFASTSPRGQENINAVFTLLDDIDKAVEGIKEAANHGITATSGKESGG